MEAVKRRFHAEQVGSLLRPPQVLESRRAHMDGRVSIDELRRIEDLAIADALRRQRDAGLDVLTDGEMRRGAWLTEMADAVDGFTTDRVTLEWKGPGGRTEPTLARVAGATLQKRRKLSEHEVPFLRSHAEGPFKITLPAPSNFMFASYKPGVSDRAYPTRQALLDAVVDIIEDEVRWLVQQRVSYIQFDAPYYSHYLDPVQRERFRREDLDPDLELARAIAGDNRAFAAAPADTITRAMHVCRGNNQSRWYMEGPYDRIAEKLFAELDVDVFLLEYDDERSGGFDPLRFVPAGKSVALGLITTKSPRLESLDGLLKRIDEASGHVPLERLALSPQCGFASVAAGNLLTADDQWRKLELVAETARRVWGD
jgi:5-methyltetrahydropteroyltriglutamate--homocysteine methyltransferase